MLTSTRRDGWEFNMANIGMPELILIAAVCLSLVTVAWPTGRICRRAGFSPWLGVVAIVPIANIVLLWFLALAEWPAVRRRVDA
jgi:hypothetical protein